jgi:hypothetical protein
MGDLLVERCAMAKICPPKLLARANGGDLLFSTNNISEHNEGGEKENADRN